MNLYIFDYNNYYNRIVKKEETIAGYGQYLYLLQNTNFVPNDGVNTEHLIGSGDYSGGGNYLVAVNDLNEIVSRWFIIESVRTRGGQWNLILHRDLVADHYDELLNAPMFIEKATLTDSDPGIWNNEGIAVNQIKTNEYVLRDKTRCAWIVGYLSRDFLAVVNENKDTTFTLNTSAPIADFVLGTSIDNWQYKGVTAFKNSNAKLYFDLKEHYQRAEPNYYRIEYSAENKRWTKYGISSSDTSYYVGFGRGGTAQGVVDKLNLLNTTKLNQALTMYQPDATSTQEDIIYDELINKYNNSTIEDSSGDTFRVSVRSSTSTRTLTITTDILDQLYVVTAINNALADYGEGSRSYRETYTRTSASPVLSTVSDTSGTVNIPASPRRPHLSDAPYDMFCIPCNLNDYDITMFLKGKSGEPASPPNDDEFTLLDYPVTLGFVQDLARQLGDNLIDIQLLPFCPIHGFEFDAATNTLSFDNIYTSQYRLINSGTVGVYNVMFWVSNSEGSYFSNELDLVNTLTNTIVNLPLPIDNFKLANECDMYRLCSPNYNGQFEFNSSKINGITGFNVDYTYLPYSPYIKVSPDFAGLYGQDFDDVRGLICQGDFSISYMSDPWINYQIQNKNYANVFNRQIQNMEVTQDVERKKQVFNAVTGTIMGGAGGAVMGAKGGVAGAIAGAVVGTAAGAVGGALDVKYGDILRAEALDYTKDMYNYSLDNIKALPDSIQKVTAYTKNNKIFPVLEHYTCTEVEKRALANKIAYNGMTTMRIGTISDFIGNTWSYQDIESKGYIKGKLIRLETLNDDYHIVNALSGELDKGVFIT